MTESHNRLRGEESPYLLQHADNPVHWYPWCEEAFEEARRSGKAIIVSIGYATCHWCHVMERESFEDPQVAALMNATYVCIKVDREERPDVDHYFMEAVQYLGISGGWPLNVFLTPEGQPFYGGTYFPPEPRHGRPAWSQVLVRLHRALTERPGEVYEQARRLTELLQKPAAGRHDPLRDKTMSGGDEERGNPWQHFYNRLREQFDEDAGGMGAAPKFPQFATMYWLQAFGFHENIQEASEHVRFSLARMLSAGIWDMVGGGMSRYAVDRSWNIPHFEKMLYDNALLLSLMAREYKRRPHPFLKRRLEEEIGFLFREMRMANTGYASAIDADSEGVEGKFYVWSIPQLRAILGEEELELLRASAELSAAGNWEGTNILYFKRLPGSADEQMDRHELDSERLGPVLRRIFKAREKRVRPITDHKVITGWNAMLACGMYEAAAALGRADWRQEADRLVAYLDDTHRSEDGRLLRFAATSKRALPAYLEDIAWMVRAMLLRLQFNPDAPFHEKLSREIDACIRDFYDGETGIFYENREGSAGDIGRVHQWYDAGQPSGNAVMMSNLMEAALLLGREDWEKMAAHMKEAMWSVIHKYPSSMAYWALGAYAMDRGPDSLAVVGADYEEYITEALSHYRPFLVIDGTGNKNSVRPLISDKEVAAKTIYYFCGASTCYAPVSEVSELRDLLSLK